MIGAEGPAAHLTANRIAGRLNGHPFATTELPSTASAKEPTSQSELSHSHLRGGLPVDGHECSEASRLPVHGHPLEYVNRIVSQRPAIHRTHGCDASINMGRRLRDTQTTPAEGSNDSRRRESMGQ